ncbi:MAG: DUF5057 domain-containing protein [Lachnospiraceae bacterium]|nr:DUF5057 domain-containing protein [Lachnospiraceae bacterium]
MKRVWNNLSKGKKLAGLVAVCLAVVVGYFGYHRLTSHAEEKISRGVINDIAQLPTNMSAADGTAENPFVILEIVPYVGKAEFGYLIDGCEPYAFNEHPEYYYELYRGAYAIGNAVRRVFAEEYDANDKLAYPGSWERDTSTKFTAYGYYEKVASGAGNFKYTGNTYADDSGDIASGTIYRPNFEKVTDGTGDYIWVTIGSPTDQDSSLSKDTYVRLAKLENKYAKEAGASINFEEGDREYTIREGNDTYYSSDSTNYESTRHPVHFDTFVRTSLNIRKKSDVENYHIVIKTIEPKQLAETPEWIDYADLIYMHQSGSSSGKNHWNTEKYNDLRRIKDTGTGTISSTFFNNGDNDFSWRVARTLFMKVNALEKYDGNGEFKFAPLLWDASITTGVQFNNTENVTTHYLDYTTLEHVSYSQSPGGSNLNLYKFLVMNFLLKQENFYKYFFCNQKASGGTVIPNEPNLENNQFAETGLCTSQDAGLAQEYWNQYTFYPVGENADSPWEITQDQVDLYGINQYGGILHMGSDGYTNVGLNGATFSYNADNLFTQMIDTNTLSKDNPSTSDAFEWYEKEYGKEFSNMNAAQMIHYLLNYKKQGTGDSEDPSRKKETLRVLEIEPCNEFTLNETYLTAKLPPSRYKGNIEIDYMTTQEFNGSRKDIIGEYDLVYVGLNDGKFNHDSSNNTVYNENSLKKKILLHVGDNATEYRFSGNDISRIKRKELKNYVKGGNGLLVAKDLKSLNKMKVDVSSNLYKFAESDIKNKENVIVLDDLTYSFLNNYCVTYRDSKLTVTDNPPEYTSDDSSEGNGGSATANAQLSDSKLDFTFTIGSPKKKVDGEANAKYGIKIFMDIDYDGVVADNSEESELVYDSYVDADSDQSDELTNNDSSAGNSNSPKKYYEYIDKVGNETAAEVVQKNTHSVSFDFNTFYKNRKLASRRNGAIAWKFVIYDTSNPQYYVAKTGTSWYNGAGAGKMEVNVYQIIGNDVSDTAVNLQNKPELFKTYTENLENYEIHVTTETLAEYLKKFTEAYPYSSGEDYSEATINQFESYNVFLISCGKELQEADNANGAVSFITKQAEEGASVLYTNDAVSKSSSASASITQGIKDILNQSRFTDGDASYVDKPTRPTASETEYSLEDYKSLEFTYAAAMEEGEGTYNCFDNDIWKQVDGKTEMAYGVSSQKTDTITRLNQGTVTTYPYTISDRVKVSGIAAKDFQLNMNNGELTVWYCLGGEEDTMYGISPNDATNNYYLYSAANVTYSGVDLENVTDPMEMKLFINTLIGNYEIGYKNPHVAVDDIKGIESEKKDCLELTLNSDSTDSLKIFDAKMPKLKKQYLEYVPSPKPIATASPEPTPSLEPEETEGPAPTQETEVTAPTPKPTPIRVIYENADGSSVQTVDMGTKYGEHKRIDDLEDTNMIRIKYHTTESLAADTIVFGLKDKDWADITEIKACQGASTDSAQTQIYDIQVGELKSTLTAKGKDLSYLGIDRRDWRAVVDSVKVYASKEDADASEETNAGGGSSGGSNPTEDMDTSLTAEFDQELADESTFIADALRANKNLTHRIYFTPYDNNVAGGNIRSLRISLVNRTKNQEDKTHSLVKTIYQDYRDIATNKRFIRRFRVGEDGNFSTANKNFLKDNTQYYFLYDERFINGMYEGVKYNYVKFEIENRKKKGVTYLNLFPDTQADNMYVFPLD